jgi:uncharacterized membrane protein (UPF0127 family)
MPADGSGRRVRVVHARTGAPLALAALADTPWTRMVGLLRHASLAPGDGIVLVPCGLVHTCFMRFAIDLLFVDRKGAVLRAVEAVPPFRLVWGGWRARTTVELPAGTLRRAGIGAGDAIRLERA